MPTASTGRTLAFIALLSSAIAVGRFGFSPATAEAASAIDITSTIDAATHAIEANQFGQADALLRGVLEDEPDHSGAATLLHELYSSHGKALPVDEDAIQRSLDALGRDYRRTETNHFVILSNADRKWTRQRAALLERAHHQFTRVMRQLQLETTPPQTKMQCVLIADHGDYQHFASLHDRVEAPWVAGYYASLSNRIVMYDDATGPTFAHLSQQLGDLDGKADEAAMIAIDARRAGERDYARAAADHARYLDTLAASERKRIEKVLREVSDAKAVHEATHQVSFNCGLQSRSHQYPFWLTEGLATCFEPPDPRKSFGPDIASDSREAEWDRVMKDNTIRPVRQLVSLVGLDHAHDNDEAAALYAESYALFRYLFRYERDSLAAYFRDIQREPAGRISARRHLEMFTKRFGDPDALERQWMRQEQR